MEKIDITPIEIRDYAISYGWTLVKEALEDDLFVLNSPEDNYKQLIFPVDSDNPDYKELVDLSVGKLAEYTKKSVFRVFEEIREVNDDVISIRYFSENKTVNSLSFQEALKSIEATKQMILSAGSSVADPVLYHKRLSRSEATDLLKKTKFRHTEEGSFILKLSCPVEFDQGRTAELFSGDNEKPFSRQAFELINQGSSDLLASIQKNSFEELYKAERPAISYNFCDALLNLFDDERELPFELIFNWSKASKSFLPYPQMSEVVKFPYAFKPKINKLKNDLKPIDKEISDTFFATVESLNGNEGEQGGREGEVILGLIADGTIIRAKAILDADYYKIAHQSHGISGSLVKTKGNLLPGSRTRNLENISVFELVNK